VTDHGPGYLDAMVFFERIDDFTDSTDARRWADIEVDGEPLPDRYLDAPWVPGRTRRRLP
jgi:hypothetical protein